MENQNWNLCPSKMEGNYDLSIFMQLYVSFNYICTYVYGEHKN